MKWEKFTIRVDGCPVNVYINEKNCRAVLFPSFGRFYSIQSDQPVMNTVMSFLFPSHGNDFGYGRYIRSLEDTGIIYKEAV